LANGQLTVALRGVAPFAALVVFVGCASTGGVRVEPLDVGVVREFNSDYTTVLQATRSAITNVGLAIDSDENVNDSTAMIIAKNGT